MLDEHLQTHTKEDESELNNNNKIEHIVIGNVSAVANIKHSISIEKYMARKSVCSICGKRYVNNSRLHKHMRSHTGERRELLFFLSPIIIIYSHQELLIKNTF